MTGALKLGVWMSLLALAAGLPLFMVGTPCLSSTSPANTLEGHLGTMTDMSILRLLNALDPDPSSAQGGLVSRALPSTIAPALRSARARLIVLLVILSVLGCGGGLLVIWKTFRSLAKGQEKLDEERERIDMVIVPRHEALAWHTLSTQGVQRWLKSRLGNQTNVQVHGVFGIP